MKKCVILFAILLVTLIIAVWTERKQETRLTEQIALDEGINKRNSGAEVSLSKY